MIQFKTHGAEVEVLESLPAVAADACELVVRMSREADARNEPFRVALAGGSSPRLLYGLLASDTFRDSLDWLNARFFFGDERWVPHAHRDSNYKLAHDELFRKLNLDPEIIFPMPTEGISPEEAAQQYEETIHREFNLRKGEIPKFSLILLGMGDDGHTASLFPHTEVLHERKKLVAAPYVEKLTSHRITLTPPVLQAAREVLFLVAGASKAPALKQVLEGEENIEEYPSQLLRHARGKVTWLVDMGAAAQLSNKVELENKSVEGD